MTIKIKCLFSNVFAISDSQSSKSRFRGGPAVVNGTCELAPQSVS